MRSKLLLVTLTSVAAMALAAFGNAACSTETTVAGAGPDAGGTTTPPVKKPKAPLIDQDGDNEEAEPPPETQKPPTYDVDAKQLAGTSAAPVGILGDDFLYFDRDDKSLYALPILGGEKTKIADIAGAFETTPTVNFRLSGGALALWTDIVDNVGKLSIWTRAGGLKEIEPKANAAIFIATPTLSRILFLKDVTLNDKKEMTSSTVVVENPDGTKVQSLTGPYAVNWAATKTCAPQIFFAGDNVWAQYCTGTSDTAARARLVVIQPGGIARLDAADLAAADTLRGDAPFDFATRAFMVELSAAEKGGKAKLKDLTQPLANPAATIEDAVVDGQVFNDSVMYITAPDLTLKKNDLTLANPAKTLATDVGAITLATADAKWILFNSKAAPAKTFLLDTSAATPAPISLGLTTAVPAALIAGGTNLTYVGDKAVKTRLLADGTVKELAKPALGFRSGPKNSLLFYTASQPANKEKTVFFYEVSFLPDNIKGGKAVTLTGAALSTQFYFHTKTDQVIYRRAYPAELGGGIYIATLPVNQPPPAPDAGTPPPPADAGSDAAP